MRTKRHDSNLTKVRRKSAAVRTRMQFCATSMRGIDTFIQSVTTQLVKREKQVEALMMENAMLRGKHKLPPRKSPPADIPFVFPALPDDPMQIMSRKIEEILPLPEHLDLRWKSCRSRLIHVSRDANWHTIWHVLDNNGGVQEPSWFGLERYRNVGEMGLRMLAASLNYYKVTRENHGKIKKPCS